MYLEERKTMRDNCRNAMIGTLSNYVTFFVTFTAGSGSERKPRWLLQKLKEH